MYKKTEMVIFKSRQKKFKGVLKIKLCGKRLYVMRCAIWYHLYNLKNVKNTHGGVLILVKLQASSFRCFHC